MDDLFSLLIHQKELERWRLNASKRFSISLTDPGFVFTELVPNPLFAVRSAVRLAVALHLFVFICNCLFEEL